MISINPRAHDLTHDAAANRGDLRRVRGGDEPAAAIIEEQADIIVGAAGEGNGRAIVRQTFAEVLASNANKEARDEEPHVVALLRAQDGVAASKEETDLSDEGENFRNRVRNPAG